MKKNIVIIVLLIVIAILSVALYLNIKNNNGKEEKATVSEANTTTKPTATSSTKPEVKELDFSEKEIKESLQNYLDLCGYRNASPSALAKYLFEDAEIYYDEVEDTYIKTNISYKDFKEKMLTYMSEKEYKEFIDNGYGEPEFKELDGFLYVNNTGASGDNWEVDSIEEIDTNTYDGKTYWIFDEMEETKEEVHFTFTITELNGKCVIDSCSDGETEE